MVSLSLEIHRDPLLQLDSNLDPNRHIMSKLLHLLLAHSEISIPSKIRNCYGLNSFLPFQFFLFQFFLSFYVAIYAEQQVISRRRVCMCLHLREEPLMIWGGLGQKRLKKTQRLLAQENLNCRLARKKNSTAGWPGKKAQHEFSARGSPQIINGPSLRVENGCAYNS